MAIELIIKELLGDRFI